MNVSFSIGGKDTKKNEKVINTLKKTADNVKFFSYSSIQELIKEASLRHIDFKRIIFSTALLNDAEKDLNDLNNFIKEFSSSTEVVMIINSVGVDAIFNQIFNSPMYTPVLLAKATPKNLLELVLSDILELKAKYYSLDVGNTASVKNTAETQEEKIEEENISKDMSIDRSLGITASSRFASGPVGINNEEDGGISSDSKFIFDKIEEKLTENSEGSAVVGDSENVGQDLGINEDELLSIGSFGSSHTDTGYLDEDDTGDKELEEFINKQALEKKSNTVERRKTPQTQESIKVETRKIKVDSKPMSVERENLPNIDIILSARDYRATQSIVDEADKIHREDNAKVLIIDLDVKTNNILSFIDIDRFYRSNAQEGISKQRLYEEDGISIASNGYGTSVSTLELKTFLEGRLPRGFDMIYIDCPTDCLDIIDKELIDLFNVIIYSSGEKGNLISMSLSLTDRSKVSLDVEKVIMNTCLVDLEGTCLDEDIRYMSSACLFANGNWLDRKDV